MWWIFLIERIHQLFLPTRVEQILHWQFPCASLGTIQMIFPVLVFLGLKNNDCCGCCGNESCGRRFAVSELIYAKRSRLHQAKRRKSCGRSWINKKTLLLRELIWLFAFIRQNWFVLMCIMTSESYIRHSELSLNNKYFEHAGVLTFAQYISLPHLRKKTFDKVSKLGGN